MGLGGLGLEGDELARADHAVLGHRHVAIADHVEAREVEDEVVLALEDLAERNGDGEVGVVVKAAQDDVARVDARLLVFTKIRQAEHLGWSQLAQVGNTYIYISCAREHVEGWRGDEADLGSHHLEGGEEHVGGVGEARLVDGVLHDGKR